MLDGVVQGVGLFIITMVMVWVFCRVSEWRAKR